MPTPIGLLGVDFSKLKADTEYYNRKLPIRQFLLQPEEAHFFGMSPADKGGHRNVKMQAVALVPKPSRELRSLLPLMEWDPLPPLEDTVACEGTSSDLDSEDGHGTADDLTPNAGMHGGIKPASWSLLNPEPRQVKLLSKSLSLLSACE